MARVGNGRGGEHFFRAALEHAPDGVLIVGSDGRVELVNAQTESLFGYSRAELVGGPVDVLVPEDLRPLHARHRASFQAHPSSRPMGAGMHLMGRRKDGGMFPVEISLAPLETDKGSFVCATVRDVSEAVRALQDLEASEKRLAAIVSNAHEMIYVADRTGALTFANPAALAVMGDFAVLSRPGATFALIEPEEMDRARTTRDRIVAKSGSEQFTPFRVRDPEGRWRDLEGEANNLLDDPAVRGIVVNVRDVTERLRSQRLLAAQRAVLTRIATGESLSSCLGSVADLVLEQFDDGAVQISVADTKGSGPLRLLVRQGALVRTYPPPPIAKVVATAVETREPARLEFEDRATGALRATVALPLLAQSAQLLGVLNVCVRDAASLPLDSPVLDVARSVAQVALERQRDLDRLVDMALHDELTGLPNRTLFLDRLRQALEADKRAGTMSAVLFCDVDNFKLVNDSQGHGVGDGLLREVGERINQTLRPGDTVARFGGDEFVVLAVDLRSEEEARLVAERLVRHVRTPVEIAGSERDVTVSVGLAIASARDIDADALVDQADAALYRAKAMGRDRAEVFDAQLEQLARSRLELEEALRAALGKDELELRYQPQLDVLSGQVAAAEVLLRWNRPDHGAVSPATFVPVAEEAGLIVPIGDWVLRTACDQGARWSRDGRAVALAVNVSARQLTHSDIAGLVQGALKDSGFSPDLLRLEITETAIMEDVAVLNETLGRLTELGVTISIDDFGTGYSSLLYLKRLPVSELKIDIAFVQGLGVSVEDESIVTGIVQLARALGLSTVAEGVETEEQLTWLRRLGCTSAQGYLVGRPMPADVFWQWLTSADAGKVPHPRPGSGVRPS